MAELLTYRQDVPQESWLTNGQPTFGVDMRVSTFRRFTAGPRRMRLAQRLTTREEITRVLGQR